MLSSIRISCVAMFASVLVGGQAVAPVRKGTFELNGFAGYSYGINERAGNPSRVIGGGTLSYSITRVFLPYFEFGYFPGIGRTQTGSIPSTGRTFNAHYNVPLADIHGGVHIRVPI